MLPVQLSPSVVRAGEEHVSESVGALLPFCTLLGYSSTAGGVSHTGDEMFASTFLFASSPYSVPLSIEWGFSASPLPVKLGASTTYYCSPPFRASLEALKFKFTFLLEGK